MSKRLVTPVDAFISSNAFFTDIDCKLDYNNKRYIYIYTYVYTYFNIDI